MRLVLAFALLASLASLAACTDEPGHFPEPRSYERLVSGFDTVAECRAFQQQNPIFNCFHIASFCPDGAAEVIVTDIINPGTYGITGDRLTFELRSLGDVPPRITFTIQPDDSLAPIDFGTRPFVRDDSFNAFLCD